MAYTWTAPPTWTGTDVPTAAQLNDLSENLRFLRTKDRCHVYRNADQNVADSTWVLLTWNNEDFDNNTMHDNATNNSRVRCMSDGVYYVSFKVNFDTNTTGIRKVMLRKNSGGSDSGGTLLGTWTADGIGSDNTTVDASRIVPLNTGGTNDYVELFGWQNSGGTIATKAGSDKTYLQVVQYTG